MGINTIIKKTVTEALNPLNPYFGETDPTSLVKDKTGGAGAAKARAEFLTGHIEKNLSKAGIYGIEGYMESQGIFSVERVKTYGKPFKFSFKNKEGKEYNGIAEYDSNLSKKNGTIVLTFKSDEGTLKILFSKESLARPFMSITNKLGNFKGDKRALIGLQEGGVFDVKIIETEKYESTTTGYEKESDEIEKIKDDITKAKNDTELTKQGMTAYVVKELEKQLKAARNKSKNENLIVLKNILKENLNILLEQGEPISTKIKIIKIGIPRVGGDTNKVLSDKEFVKIKANLDFIDDNTDQWVDKNLKRQIHDGISSGIYFAKLTEKYAKKMLIISKDTSGKGDYFTIIIDNIKNPADPNQWKGTVEVSKNALNTNFKGSEAKIRNLSIK